MNPPVLEGTLYDWSPPLLRAELAYSLELMPVELVYAFDNDFAI